MTFLLLNHKWPKIRPEMTVRNEPEDNGQIDDIDDTTAAFERIIELGRDTNEHDMTSNQSDNEESTPLENTQTKIANQKHDNVIVLNDGQSTSSIMDNEETPNSPRFLTPPATPSPTSTIVPPDYRVPPITPPPTPLSISSYPEPTLHTTSTTTTFQIKCPECMTPLSFSLKMNRVDYPPSSFTRKRQLEEPGSLTSQSKQPCLYSSTETNSQNSALTYAGITKPYNDIPPLRPYYPPMTTQTVAPAPLQQPAASLFTTLLSPPTRQPMAPPNPQTPATYYHEFVFNESARYYIMGHMGANLRAIGAKYRVRVHLKCRPNDSNIISGSPDACYKALGELKKLELEWLEDHPPSQA